MEVRAFLYFLIIPIVLSLRCVPNYHTWRPFYGKTKIYDFIAANDDVGSRYIAKVIVPDRTSHTVPAVLNFDHVVFAWPNSQSMRIDRFIEVLGSAYWKPQYHNLEWVHINRTTCYLGILSDCLCIIEGGGVFENGKYNPFYIGRAFRNKTYLFGRVPKHENMVRKRTMHTMDGWNPVTLTNDFEVLTYPPAD